MILTNHPTGNENVRQAALALAETNQLFEFWTCVGLKGGAGRGRGVGRVLRRSFGRRALPCQVFSRTRLVPIGEAMRHVSAYAAHVVGGCPIAVDRIYTGLDSIAARRVCATKVVSGVFGYEDGSLAMFSAAREGGLRRIYELPMGYWRAWRRMLNDEKTASPDWASTLQGIEDGEEKLSRKEGELDSAEVVLVASEFARQTLVAHGRCTLPIHVLPYGVSVTIAEPIPSRKNRSLKVIYVGALTQRKGISYLFDAVKGMEKHVEVLVIGAAPSASSAPLSNALKAVRWLPTASHETVLEEMRQCDVLILPSLFEGFGLVILEALAQGITVVTTGNTGGADVLTDGKDGFIVPIRSADAIRERLTKLIEVPGLLEYMRREALATARKNSWAIYRRRFAQLCAGLDNGESLKAT